MSYANHRRTTRFHLIALHQVLDDLVAAVWLRENCQTPQNDWENGTKRPLGPFGAENVQQSAATCGASRLATAHAEGGFQINALLPEISARLLDASS